MKEELKKRDYYFDNIKTLMIFLVVLGHFIELGMYKNGVFQSIWYAIYLFHMPIFVFVTGYFTKLSQNNTEKAIKNYLLPYIVFSTALYIFRVLILKQDIQIQFLMPQYGMWFLISVFWYKIMYNGIYKIRGIFTISIVLAVVVGLDNSFTNLAAFSRTVVFLPFFIVGTKFKKEYLIQDKKWLKYSIYLLLPAILIIFGYLCVKLEIPMDLLRGSIPYKNLNISVGTAVIERIVVLLLSFVVGYMILNIVPSKKNAISYIGENTIITYILHIFFILYCKEYKILNGTSYKTFLISVVLTTIIVFVTSLPIFKKTYNRILERIVS